MESDSSLPCSQEPARNIIACQLNTQTTHFKDIINQFLSKALVSFDFFHIYTEAMERSPNNGGDDNVQVNPLCLQQHTGLCQPT